MKNNEMSVSERFRLWNVTEEERINESVSIVVNNEDGRKMLRKTMDISLLELHRMLCRIKHENIAEIYDVREVGGQCVILEEYVNGRTAEELIGEGRTVTEKTAGEYILQLCKGLRELHSRGIIHRDLSPSNVMITADGKIKIIDFGISRFPNSSASRDTQILGTAGYAAPEQFGFQQTDTRSDIYAIGVLLNFFLTGKIPNEQFAYGEYAFIIKKCTMLDPKERYLSVDAVIRDISSVLKTGDSKFRKTALKIIRNVPGFRGKNPIAAFFAVYFYITAIFTQTAFISMWIRTDIIMMFKILGRFQFLFTLPFIFYTDFLNLSSHLPFIKKCSKRTKKTVFAVLGTLSLAAGIGFLALLQVPST